MREVLNNLQEAAAAVEDKTAELAAQMKAMLEFAAKTKKNFAHRIDIMKDNLDSERDRFAADMDAMMAPIQEALSEMTSAKKPARPARKANGKAAADDDQVSLNA